MWINSHGLTAAEITLSPIKDSGIGYFGGKEGFYEYVQIRKTTNPLSISETINKINNLYTSFVSYAKKSQENWAKMSKLNKAKIFQKFADYIDTNKKSLR